MATQATITAVLAGLLAGIYFFGGLWWTVRRGLLASRPVAIFLSSFVLRYSAVLVMFWLIFEADAWMASIVAFFLGFIISRGIVKHLTGRITIIQL
ncbi:MAG: ATP synthase subunit I [Syntrophomonadaceae bacterium]